MIFLKLQAHNNLMQGNTYKGKIKLMSGGKRLILRGYLGTSLIGRNQTWIRVE